MIRKNPENGPQANENENHGVGENTAVNRGANMFVTHDEAEALAWLLKF